MLRLCRAGDRKRHVRLHRDRGRLGWLCAGRAPLGRPGGARVPAGGGPGRPQCAYPLPGGAGGDGALRALRLGPEHHAPARAAGAQRLPAARQGAGRLQLGQCHDLCPWSAPGLRPLGSAGQPRLGLERCAAVFFARPAQRARRQRLARHRRPAERDGFAHAQPLQRRVCPSRCAGGLRAQPRLQWRGARGRGPVPGDAQKRRTLQCGQGVSDTAPVAAQPASAHWRAGHAHPVRGTPCRGRGVPPGRLRAAGALHARGAAECGRCYRRSC